jgi:hypothetical protein
VTPKGGSEAPQDDGLRRVLTWTFLALFGALAFSAIAIYLVVHFFG